MQIDIVAYFKKQAENIWQGLPKQHQEFLLDAFKERIDAVFAEFSFVSALEDEQVLAKKEDVLYKCKYITEPEVTLIATPYEPDKATQFNQTPPITLALSDCIIDANAKENCQIILYELLSMAKKSIDWGWSERVRNLFLEQAAPIMVSDLISNTIGYGTGFELKFSRSPDKFQIKYVYAINNLNDAIIICELLKTIHFKVKEKAWEFPPYIKSVSVERTDFDFNAYFYDKETIAYLTSLTDKPIMENADQFAKTALEYGILPDSRMHLNSEQGIITLDDQSKNCNEKEQLEAVALGMLDANSDFASLYAQTRCSEHADGWLKKGFNRVLRQKGSDR